MRYFFSTGEASGEFSAVLLAQALRARDPDASFEGIGATRMRDAGFSLWRDHTGWASMGIVAALPRIPKLLVEMWRTALHIAHEKPDLVILVDFGAFNVRLAKALRESLHYRGAILYLFPPSAWLDSERTARAVSRWTTPLTAFAHQEQFYRSLGLRIEYFGHPLLAEYRERTARPVPPRDGGSVALLPGSRGTELSRHVAILLRALALLQRRRPGTTATIAVADRRFERSIASAVARARAKSVRIEQGVRAALADADAAWVASGTAVLETLLLGVPAIALYVVSPLVVWYGRRMRRRIYGGRFITLPNLVTQESIIEEYLQDDATPERLAAAMDRLLEDPQPMRNKLARLRAALGSEEALERCADFAVALARGDAP